MHGINNGIEILNHLSVNLDIICLQEHWLRPGDLTPFAHLIGFDKFIHSGMKGGDVHLVDRPYGGLAVLLNSSVIHSILDIGCSINNRVQGVFFEYFIKKFILFGVYLLCLGAKDYDSDVNIVNAFMLNAVHNVMSPDTEVIIAGDFNADLDSVNHLNSLNALKQFTREYGLKSCFDYYSGGYLYTYRRDARSAYSKIDIIFIPVNEGVIVNSVEIVDDHLNLSDHLPIICRLRCNVVQAPFRSVSDNFYNAYVLTDATKQQYYYSTGTSLQSLMNDISDVESNISADEYVNVLHDGIVKF